jgi:hypothetical protein
MRWHWRWMVGLLLSTATAGCSSVAKPDVLHPGTTADQQQRALRYDPYPEPEGPSVDGSRPREYTTPPPETSRARWQLGNWGQ